MREEKIKEEELISLDQYHFENIELSDIINGRLEINNKRDINISRGKSPVNISLIDIEKLSKKLEVTSFIYNSYNNLSMVSKKIWYSLIESHNIGFLDILSKGIIAHFEDNLKYRLEHVISIPKSDFSNSQYQWLFSVINFLELVKPLENIWDLYVDEGHGAMLPSDFEEKLKECPFSKNNIPKTAKNKIILKLDYFYREFFQENYKK